MTANSGRPRRTPVRFSQIDSVVVRAISLAALLYLFILSIKLLEASFGLFGSGFVDAVFRATSNPVIALLIGVLVTAIIQSSSATTSLIVGLVGAGTISFEHAIPMVMGANIGTTITNMIVSMASISRSDEFKRAYASATVHDFFNICSVIILLPLQVKFNIIGTTARWLQTSFEGFGGMKFSSPLKAVTEPVAAKILHLTGDSGWLGAVIALLLLFVALRYIVRVLKSMVLAKVERFFDRYIFRTAALSFGLGAILTALVQSSSITSSIVVPLVGAGVISLEQVFPYLLGANIGTTITAFLASFVTNSTEAVAVAFAHLVFNIFGILIFWPLRVLPITLARKLSNAAIKSKVIPFAYIIGVFFIIPGIIIFLMR
ncbi:MAG: Na/Pi symporter [Candidatus Zixiibacteriota bacterium]|nr:MAG: Na/Pi symporter [candidate division Zixibacteria bacterium]